MHDSGVPPDHECLRLIEPQPDNPQEAATLLPALKNYVPSVAFEGTRDVRVTDHAKTLWVAVWLHRLDMAVGGEALASETLEA